jgi:cellulose synthase/poly-beta-1,6-N-acetylglucosamine synthase-like glycosyltransferase
MKDSVSIIIPAFNEERDLPGCLRSIKELDFPKERIEIIVVDNGSRDRTREQRGAVFRGFNPEGVRLEKSWRQACHP